MQARQRWLESRHVPVTWEVARDAQFREIVARGVALARAENDYTVKVDVGALRAATHLPLPVPVPGHQLAGRPHAHAAARQRRAGASRRRVVLQLPGRLLQCVREDRRAGRPRCHACTWATTCTSTTPTGYASEQAPALGRVVEPANELLTLADYRAAPRPVPQRPRRAGHARRAADDRRLGRPRDRQRHLDRRRGEPQPRPPRAPGRRGAPLPSRPTTSGCPRGWPTRRGPTASTAASTSATWSRCTCSTRASSAATSSSQLTQFFGADGLRRHGLRRGDRQSGAAAARRGADRLAADAARPFVGAVAGARPAGADGPHERAAAAAPGHAGVGLRGRGGQGTGRAAAQRRRSRRCWPSRRCPTTWMPGTATPRPARRCSASPGRSIATSSCCPATRTTPGPATSPMHQARRSASSSPRPSVTSPGFEAIFPDEDAAGLCRRAAAADRPAGLCRHQPARLHGRDGHAQRDAGAVGLCRHDRDPWRHGSSGPQPAHAARCRTAAPAGDLSRLCVQSHRSGVALGPLTAVRERLHSP